MARLRHPDRRRGRVPLAGSLNSARAPCATAGRRAPRGTVQQRVTATFRRADGRALHMRKATRAEPALRKVYDALGTDPRPGGTRKTTI